MSSRRRHEGDLLIDRRNGPGITEADLATVPEHARGGFLVVPGAPVVEAPTLRCSHCGTMVILNPDRKRPRNYCAKCDHYVCDNAGCVIGCKHFVQRVDETIEQNARHIYIKEGLAMTTDSLGQILWT